MQILFRGSILCMIGGGRYNATVGLSPSMSNISALFMIIMSLWSLIPLVKQYGYRGWNIIISLGLFALGIETIGIMTGFPYGSFEYGDLLGYKLGGITPWTVFIGWTPLVLGAYMLGGYLCQYLCSSIKTIQTTLTHLTLSTVILVNFDFVLDPGAVFLGMWYFQYPGIYYGVPWSNFGGWVISGLIGRRIIHRQIGDNSSGYQYTNLYIRSALLSLVFWTSVSITAGYSIPSVIGICWVITGGIIAWTTRKNTSLPQS